MVLFLLTSTYSSESKNCLKTCFCVKILFCYVVGMSSQKLFDMRWIFEFSKYTSTHRFSYDMPATLVSKSEVTLGEDDVFVNSTSNNVFDREQPSGLISPKSEVVPIRTTPIRKKGVINSRYHFHSKPIFIQLFSWLKVDWIQKQIFSKLGLQNI